MTDTTSKPGRKPTHRAFTTKSIGGSDGDPTTLWTQIGAAWPLKSGNGYILRLDATPLNGEIVLLDKAETPSDDTHH